MVEHCMVWTTLANGRHACRSMKTFIFLSRNLDKRQRASSWRSTRDSEDSLAGEGRLAGTNNRVHGWRNHHKQHHSCQCRVSSSEKDTNEDFVARGGTVGTNDRVHGIITSSITVVIIGSAQVKKTPEPTTSHLYGCCNHHQQHNLWQHSVISYECIEKYSS